jgi:hypothetical protein
VVVRQEGRSVRPAGVFGRGSPLVEASQDRGGAVLPCIPSPRARSL